MHANRKVAAALAIAGLGFLAGRSYATPVIVQSPYQLTAFSVDGSDLINGHAPFSISGTQDQESVGSSTNGAALTNGTFGPANARSSGSQITIVNNGAEIIYTVPASKSITEIDTYSSWQDGGRSQQNYLVSFSSDNISYSTPIAVNASQDPYGTYPPDNKPSDDKVAITDSTGTIASGVQYIKFDFPGVENTYVGFTEIDVLPEPASLSLLGLGGLGLLARRRKA